MRAIRTRVARKNDFTIECNGGLNDSASPVRMKPGDLTYCLNYMEVDGGKPGYKSICGYEIFDGQALASSIALGASDDDTAREVQRALMAAPTGSGTIRGVHIYDGGVYCKRNNAGATAGLVYKSTGSGWSSLTLPSTPTAVWAGGTCRWINASFAAYPTSSPPTANAPCWFMVDGVSQPISYDGTTVRRVDHANLPSNASFSPAQVFPTHVIEFDQRLWLVFPGGHVYASDTGDPAAWTAGIYYGLGGEVTNVVKSVGNSLIFFLEEAIKIITVPDGYSSSFLYKLTDFVGSNGARIGTAQSLLGDIYFIGDQGLTSLEATQKYGAFAAGAIGKKLWDTYETNRENLVATVVHRKFNQYRMYFSDGLVLCFTFKGSRVSSATRWMYDQALYCICAGESSTGAIETYFGGTDGVVYKEGSGTSFDGDVISTRLTTAFFDYGARRNNKLVGPITPELTAETDTELYLRLEFNYRDGTSPRSVEQELSITESGGVWGSGVWGTFIWGGKYVNAPAVYLTGYGFNIALSLRSSSKYRTQHTVHDFVVDYEVLTKIM